jgi:hypothetical protein
MAIYDQTFLTNMLTNFYKATGACTLTATGGTTQVVNPPFHLRLGTTTPTNTSAMTELSGTGYTAGGSSLGASFAGTVTAAAFTNANAVSWTAGSSWSTITSIEIWDTSGTPVRHLFGALSANITGVANTDTVQFGVASISVSLAAV